MRKKKWDAKLNYKKFYQNLHQNILICRSLNKVILGNSYKSNEIVKMSYNFTVIEI